MRVIAGKARGTKLKMTDLPSARPTLDRVKESIFSTIQYNLKGTYCLDAFACTGSLGIEALSRGCLAVDFCEKDKKTFTVLKDNLSKTRLLDCANCFHTDVFDFIKTCNKKYDFVFLDPPYNKGLLEKIIDKLFTYDCLSDKAIIVCEHEKTTKYNDYKIENDNKKLVFFKQKDFSDTIVSYFKVEE